MSSPGPNSEERVLVIAPVGQDAPAMAALLNRQGFEAKTCEGPAEAARQIQVGAGALLLTEEALELPHFRDLLQVLQRQPAWSELPLIILTSGGESKLAELLDMAASAAGSLTLLERPLGTGTLLRSVEFALHSRRRQYQVRDLIQEQQRREQQLTESEKLLRQAKEFDEAVINNMGEGLYTVDSQGLVTFMNPAAERLLGWTLDELRGRKMHDATHYQHRDGTPFPAEECAGLLVLRQGKSLIDYEDVFIRKDGTFLDVVYSSSPIREGQDTIGLAVVFRDITDRKRAEETRARLAAIVESSEDAIISKDLNGIIKSWNRGAERLFGYRQKEAIGQSITMLIPADRLAEEAIILERIRRNQPLKHYETVRRRKDGTLVDISLTVSPITDRQGRIIGASKIARDITARRQAEKALTEAQVQLQDYAVNLEHLVSERTSDLRATNEQLEAFVYSIAHDLRAPLRTMGGYSQLLVEDYAPHLDPAAQHLLKRIQASSEFMDKLILDLLAYGRTARAEMELVPLSVKIAWDTALFQCATQIEQSKAQIETIQPLPKVLAHEATLGQCLANLLGNALKFVAPGVRPHVRFWPEERGDKIRLWVADNGLGIPAEQHERVFRVFERLHGSRYVGTGIGLSIVRKGVERMGGKVGLESEVGKGSQFWIELPKAD